MISGFAELSDDEDYYGRSYDEEPVALSPGSCKRIFLHKITSSQHNSYIEGIDSRRPTPTDPR